MTSTAPARSTAAEAKLRQLIHIAKSQLGMDEETYRAMLQSVGGASSTKHLRHQQLQRVLEHLKRAGFKVRPQGRGRAVRAQGGQHSKVRALWLFLHELGAVQDPSERALAAYVKRITRVDDLSWVSLEQLDQLIETLKKWAMRYLPDAVQKLVAEVSANDSIDWQTDDAQKNLHYIRRTSDNKGFDAYYWAWVACMQLLQRPIHPKIAPQNKKAGV